MRTYNNSSAMNLTYKNILLITSLLISSFLSHAQFEDKLSWENDDSFIPATPKLGHHIGSIGENHFVMYYGQKATISRVNRANIEQSSRTLRYGVHKTTKNNREFLKLKIINDKLILFTSDNSMLSQGEVYFMEILNPVTLETTKEVQIGETTNEFVLTSTFDVIVDSVSSKDLFFVSTYPKIKNAVKLRNVKCVSTDGEIKWDKDLTTRLPKIKTFQADMEDIHLIVDNAKTKKGIITDGLTIISITNSGDKVISREIDLVKKGPYPSQTFINKNGELEVFGYYYEFYKNSKNKSNLRLGGTYFFSFDSNKKDYLSKKITPLESDFQSQLQVKIEKEAKHKLKFSENNLTNSYSYTSAANLSPWGKTNSKYSLNDGRIIIIEQLDLYTTRKILVSKISETGDLMWSCTVPYYNFQNPYPKQGAPGAVVAAFSLVNKYKPLIYKDKLHIIYHDALENLNKDQVLQKYGYPSDNGYVADFSIDLSTGVTTRGVFLSNKSNKFIFSPIYLDQKANSIYFLTNGKDKKDQKQGNLKLSDIYPD